MKKILQRIGKQKISCNFNGFLRNYNRKVSAMEKRFKLSVEDVLNKQFNVDFKGYSSREVDEFLDLVIHDYQEYDHMIENLGNHLQEYERHIATLKAKIVELEGKQEVEAIKAELSGDNIDILKRLTRLENAVFRKEKE